MDELHLDVTRLDAAELRDSLSAAGIPFEDRTPRPKPGMIYASATEMFFVAVSSLPEGGLIALAAVIMTWIRANGRRRVTITSRKYKVTNIDAQGYSPDELKDVLKTAMRVTMIDSRKKDDR